MNERQMTTALTSCNRLGLTPLGVVAVAGLSLYAAAATATMGACYFNRAYVECEPVRAQWAREVQAVGVGFGLLFVKAPGTQAVAGVLSLLAGVGVGGGAAAGAAKAGRREVEQVVAGAVHDPREAWGQVLDAADLFAGGDGDRREG